MMMNAITSDGFVRSDCSIQEISFLERLFPDAIRSIAINAYPWCEIYFLHESNNVFFPGDYYFVWLVECGYNANLPEQDLNELEYAYVFLISRSEERRVGKEC